MTVLTPERIANGADRLLLQKKTGSNGASRSDDLSSSFSVLEEKKSTDPGDTKRFPETNARSKQKAAAPKWRHMISHGMS